jgi:2'-5' RNA ligase
VSPLPREMADRWRSRPEPGPDQAQLYWHILMKDQPEVRGLAALAQQRLARFPGLHFTPPERLHSTVLRVGPADGIAVASIGEMIEQARQGLSAVPPVSVSFGRVLYHPEAITLGIQPAGALDAVFDAVQEAAQSAVGKPEDAAGWMPHVTVAYSTAIQSATPIIAALGRELPECQITVNSVSLIAQQGAERHWDWHQVAQVQLGTTAAA